MAVPKAMPAEVTSLLREMFVIFLAAKLTGEIFERLTLPAVLGEILAGALLGPYAMALVIPSGTIDSLAQLGAVFLLFMVGLQTRPQQLIAVGQKALQVALAGMVVPFAAGFIYARSPASSPARRSPPPASASPRGCCATWNYWKPEPHRSFWAPRYSTTYWAWCCWRWWLA
ncbi:MAG: hypothetical protein DMG66_01735 [Acidobacteria bacterium]|nr:MAG: hypothetical protein DMG66_01735 [Acidobacteriota bacterium]